MTEPDEPKDSLESDPTRENHAAGESGEIAAASPESLDPQMESSSILSGLSRGQWFYIGLVIAFTAGAIAYHWIFNGPFSHTAALFLGIPGILAILLALTPKAKSVTGGIMKGMTLALLIVAPLLGEGYLCILFAAPLFYLVGAIVGVIIDVSNKKRGATLSCITLFLIPVCLEGTTPELTFDRAQTVEVTRTVNATPEQVEQALSHSPRIEFPLPTFLTIGFPRPLAAFGSGLEPGATRTIHFAGAEGDPPGDLVMTVAQHQTGYTRFETLSDTTKLTQWLRWQSSEVHWRPIDAQHTAVTWQIHFTRQLDPAWYFAPWERAAVRAAAGYLLAVNATPQTEAR